MPVCVHVCGLDAEAGHGSGGRVLVGKGWNHPIKLAWQVHCSLGYFPFEPVVHNWTINGCGMYVLSCLWEAHIKDPLLLIGTSSLGGNSGLRLKKYVTMTICLMSNSQ